MRRKSGIFCSTWKSVNITSARITSLPLLPMKKWLLLCDKEPESTVLAVCLDVFTCFAMSAILLCPIPKFEQWYSTFRFSPYVSAKPDFVMTDIERDIPYDNARGRLGLKTGLGIRKNFWWPFSLIHRIHKKSDDLFSNSHFLTFLQKFHHFSKFHRFYTIFSLPPTGYYPNATMASPSLTVSIGYNDIIHVGLMGGSGDVYIDVTFLW